MEEILKQILSEIKDLKQGQKGLEQGQKGLEQGQNNLSDKLDAFEKRTLNRFNIVEAKIESIHNAVADLMEFRTDAESRLKKIK